MIEVTFRDNVQNKDLEFERHNPNFSSFFCSFRGRINRRSYWFYSVIPQVVASFVLTGLSFYVDSGHHDLSTFLIISVFGLVFVFVLLTIVFQIKRWHDRNKSAWWLLISFIPILGSIWVLIECGFLQGSASSNRYGLPQE